MQSSQAILYGINFIRIKSVLYDVAEFICLYKHKNVNNIKNISFECSSIYRVLQPHTLILIVSLRYRFPRRFALSLSVLLPLAPLIIPPRAQHNAFFHPAFGVLRQALISARGLPAPSDANFSQKRLSIRPHESTRYPPRRPPTNYPSSLR